MDADGGGFGAGVLTGMAVVMIGMGVLAFYFWPRDISYTKATEESTATPLPQTPHLDTPPLPSMDIQYLGTGTPPFVLANPIPRGIASGTLEELRLDASPYFHPAQDTTLLATGVATMTVARTGNVNDVFIGDTQLYQSNGEKYQLMVRAEDSPIKTLHLVLPDFYKPVDQKVGGSLIQTAHDGSKQIRLRLKHDANIQTDFDAAIFVQSPTVTDEADHPMVLEEVGDVVSIFSVVQGGFSVTIEVTHTPRGIIPDTAYKFAMNKLDESVMNAQLSF